VEDGAQGKLKGKSAFLPFIPKKSGFFKEKEGSSLKACLFLAFSVPFSCLLTPSRGLIINGLVW
jgi:hypothetical protein